MKPKKTDTAAQMAPRKVVTSRAASMSAAFPAGGGGEDLVHLTLQVPSELRRRLKAAAAAGDTSVRAIVTKAIERELDSLTE